MEVRTAPQVHLTHLRAPCLYRAPAVLTFTVSDKAASIIKFATFSGWANIATWLVASVNVFAPIRLAVLISCSGAMVRSLDAITNQLGLICQAAALIGVPSNAP